MSTCDVIATYRWLVAAGNSGDLLVADSTPAFVHDARNRARRNVPHKPKGSSADCPARDESVVAHAIF